VTIYIPTWLYWYGAPPLMFLLGCPYGRLRISYREREDPPTTQRAAPRPGSVDKGAS
jgi:hypothetical protein